MTTASNNTYVYVGAEASGLYRLSPGSSQWEELTNGLPANPIVPFPLDGGRLGWG